jgi:hypothetical protein
LRGVRLILTGSLICGCGSWNIEATICNLRARLAGVVGIVELINFEMEAAEIHTDVIEHSK